MIVKAEYNYYNIAINEVSSTIKSIQCENIDKDGFIDKNMMRAICHTEYDLKNKTKNLIWSDYYLIHRGKEGTTSNGRYKMKSKQIDCYNRR